MSGLTGLKNPGTSAAMISLEACKPKMFFMMDHRNQNNSNGWNVFVAIQYSYGLVIAYVLCNNITTHRIKSTIPAAWPGQVFASILAENKLLLTITSLLNIGNLLCIKFNKQLVSWEQIYFFKAQQNVQFLKTDLLFSKGKSPYWYLSDATETIKRYTLFSEGYVVLTIT